MSTSTTARNSSGRRPGRWITGVGAASAVALVAMATPAAALERTSQDLTGVTIFCGDNLLTFTGGVQVGDLHRVELGNGTQVVILNVVFHDAVLSDQAGAVYRAVGGANSTARVMTPGDPDSLAGHFNVNITVLGDQGQVGKVMLRERTSRDGTVDLVTGGGCSL
jgi:hypothetical protein